MFAPPRCVILLTLNLTEGQDDLSSRRLAGELVNSDLRANETWRSRKSRTIPLLPCSWANWTVSKRSMCLKRKEIRGRLPEKGSFYENWKITIIFKDFFSMKNILYISFDSSNVIDNNANFRLVSIGYFHRNAISLGLINLFAEKRNLAYILDYFDRRRWCLTEATSRVGFIANGWNTQPGAQPLLHSYSLFSLPFCLLFLPSFMPRLSSFCFFPLPLIPFHHWIFVLHSSILLSVFSYSFSLIRVRVLFHRFFPLPTSYAFSPFAFRFSI